MTTNSKPSPIDSAIPSKRTNDVIGSSHVTLNAIRTIATQTHTQSGRFALIEEGMGVQNRKIKFKVTHLKNWIGVGVCLKSKIQAVNYQFKCNNLPNSD